MSKAVITGYARTPFTRFTGKLATIPAVALGGHAARHAMERSGVGPAAVERVFAGQVLQGLAGQNPARQAGVQGGLGMNVPAMTLNAVCLSGLEAVVAGAALIEAGGADVVLALGMESMSLAPHAFPGRTGTRYGAIELVDTLDHDGLTDAFEHVSMGSSTETGNDALHLDRASQDAWAARSHQRAAASREFLAEEIAPVDAPAGRIAEDDGVRPDTTAETLARLRPAFREGGTITAGNASQITDGAAALVLMSEAAAARTGATPIARVLAAALVAGPDIQLHHQPSNAILAALTKIGRDASALARVEINEAFASVALASVDALGVDPDIVNVHGGAIALGHPIGASGARLAGTLARQLHEPGVSGFGAAALCGGGGQGSAVILEAV
ncbi:acetyl-CoA C-acyltransferase [Pseudolysinimonas sp.]|uniref:acetyl-CoA C-acyltransferase n=1 Tax=Pseudolysinimonas sp. TaxID=2680009 RepID=UPI003F812A54